MSCLLPTTLSKHVHAGWQRTSRKVRMCVICTSVSWTWHYTQRFVQRVSIGGKSAYIAWQPNPKGKFHNTENPSKWIPIKVITIEYHSNWLWDHNCVSCEFAWQWLHWPLSGTAYTSKTTAGHSLWQAWVTATRPKISLFRLTDFIQKLG